MFNITDFRGELYDSYMIWAIISGIIIIISPITLLIITLIKKYWDPPSRASIERIVGNQPIENKNSDVPNVVSLNKDE